MSVQEGSAKLSLSARVHAVTSAHRAEEETTRHELEAARHELEAAHRVLEVARRKFEIIEQKSKAAGERRERELLSTLSALLKESPSLNDTRSRSPTRPCDNDGGSSISGGHSLRTMEGDNQPKNAKHNPQEHDCGAPEPQSQESPSRTTHSPSPTPMTPPGTTRKRQRPSPSPQDDEPSSSQSLCAQKRRKGDDTIQFTDVNHGPGGHPCYKIIQYPKKTDNFYILRCTVEGHPDFGPVNPSSGAVNHLSHPAHGLKKDSTLADAVEHFGVRVLGCDEQKAQRNNKALIEATGALDKRSDQRQKVTKRRNLSSENVKKLARKVATETPKPSRGVTNPQPGGIYRIKWAGAGFYAGICLGTDDTSMLGISGTMYDTGLKMPIPSCYCTEDGRITGWAEGFSDGGDKVHDRKFPVMFFDGGYSLPQKGPYIITVRTSVGWVGARNIEPLNIESPPADPKVGHVDLARAFHGRQLAIQSARSSRNARSAQVKGKDGTNVSNSVQLSPPTMSDSASEATESDEYTPHTGADPTASNEGHAASLGPDTVTVRPRRLRGRVPSSSTEQAAHLSSKEDTSETNPEPDLWTRFGGQWATRRAVQASHKDTARESDFTVPMSKELESAGSVQLEDRQSDNFITPGPGSEDYERFQSRGTRSPSLGEDRIAKQDRVQCSGSPNTEAFTEHMIPNDQVVQYDIYDTGDTPEPPMETAREPVTWGSPDRAAYTQSGFRPFFAMESRSNGRAEPSSKETTKVAPDTSNTANSTEQACLPHSRTPGRTPNPTDTQSTTSLERVRPDMDQRRASEGTRSRADTEDVPPQEAVASRSKTSRYLATKAYEFLSGHRRY